MYNLFHPEAPEPFGKHRHRRRGQTDFGAVAPGSLYLGNGRAIRKADGGVNPLALSSQSDALGVISRATGNYAALLFLFTQ